MAEVHGRLDERFSEVGDLLADNVRTGEECGAAVAVEIDGEPVVDIWAGHRDPEHREPWAEDTVVNVWSSSKPVTNLAVLLLHDRGEIDVFAPMAKYWPEFAQNGKEGVEVRHVLAHTSGVSGWEPPFTLDDLYDAVGAADRLATQAPWWEPGSASGYHAATQGTLLGELIRRVTGTTLTEFVRSELAEPLGADFQIGLRPEDDHRVATIVPEPPLDLDLSSFDPDGPMMKTVARPALTSGVANTEGWRRAEIGAANGHATARGLARIMAPLALGGSAHGVDLITQDTVDLVFRLQAEGVDLVLPVPLRFGIGYGLPDPQTTPFLPMEGICFWGGRGGSLIVMDLEHRMTACYLMNKMENSIVGNSRAVQYFSALYRALDA